ncbi:MAG TPA: hypothetical protein VE008_13690 [Burkholderiales bacterium]|nr:hypothetical protein [Burkholderiales bacterium]
MRKALILATALISWAAIPAAAQKPDIKGGSVVASEPGKAAVVSAVEISALVLAVDKASRTVTLKGPQGKVVDIVAGDEVKNFAQIKVGDYLFVRYLQSLSLELQKVKSGPTGIVEQSATATARPGERPGAAAGREVTAIAKVTAVNPKASTITLKGPRGNSVTLDVRNPEQFKVVKVGDDVRVTYTEAVAISVEAAPKPEAKKAPKK